MKNNNLSFFLIILPHENLFFVLQKTSARFSNKAGHSLQKSRVSF